MRAALLLLVMIAATPVQAQPGEDGQALYRERCAACHEGGAARAPDRAALKMLAPDEIRAALASGSMSRQGGASTRRSSMR